MVRAIDKPMPMPSPFVVKNGSNTSLRWSTGMPGPACEASSNSQRHVYASRWEATKRSFPRNCHVLWLDLRKVSQGTSRKRKRPSPKWLTPSPIPPCRHVKTAYRISGGTHEQRARSSANAKSGRPSDADQCSCDQYDGLRHTSRPQIAKMDLSYLRLF
jgi:hypothetical protein